MNPTTAAAAAPQFIYRPGLFRPTYPAAARPATRSGEFMGGSSTTWLAVGAVVVVGAVVLMGKKRRRK